MTEIAILEWNRYHKIITKLQKAISKANMPNLAIEVAYYKRLQLGDTEQEAYDHVLYRKTNILWEYRRDFWKAEI